MSKSKESTPTPSAPSVNIVEWLMTPTTERSHHDHAMCTTLKQAFTLGMKVGGQKGEIVEVVGMKASEKVAFEAGFRVGRRNAE